MSADKTSHSEQVDQSSCLSRVDSRAIQAVLGSELKRLASCLQSENLSGTVSSTLLWSEDPERKVTITLRNLCSSGKSNQLSNPTSGRKSSPAPGIKTTPSQSSSYAAKKRKQYMTQWSTASTTARQARLEADIAHRLYLQTEGGGTSRSWVDTIKSAIPSVAVFAKPWLWGSPSSSVISRLTSGAAADFALSLGFGGGIAGMVGRAWAGYRLAKDAEPRRLEWEEADHKATTAEEELKKVERRLADPYRIPGIRSKL